MIARRWLDELPGISLYQPIDFYGTPRRVAWAPRADEVIRRDEMALTEAR